jgi:CheY-like chemotaxis protein/HPt (histidine-containing phosphotransfer) domain-containing protein
MKFPYQRVERIEDAVDCNVLFILSSGDDSIDFITDDFIKNKRIITILGSTSENTNKYYSHVTLNMPINASKILDSIVDIEKIHRDKPKIAKHSNSIEKYNAVVLVAEDNPTNQKLVKILLAKHGVKVDIADNGKIAFDKYIESKKDGSIQYDLIFMDIHMPIMDGTEAVRNIRNFERNNKLNKANIVALTADAIKIHQQQYLKSGFDGFLAKPIEIDKFEKVLKKYLSEFSVKESNNDKVVSSNQTVHNIKDKVNSICDNLGLDYETSKMLLDDFMTNWIKFKKELETAIKKEDYDEVRAISHSLKGSAGSLQLDAVYNLCKDMEALAKNKAHKESNDTYKNLFNNIKDEIGI